MVNPDFYLGHFDEARAFYIHFDREIRDFITSLVIGAYFFGVHQDSVSKFLSAVYDDISSSLRGYDARYRFEQHFKNCDKLDLELQEVEL